MNRSPSKGLLGPCSGRVEIDCALFSNTASAGEHTEQLPFRKGSRSMRSIWHFSSLMIVWCILGEWLLLNLANNQMEIVRNILKSAGMILLI